MHEKIPDAAQRECATVGSMDVIGNISEDTHVVTMEERKSKTQNELAPTVCLTIDT